MNVKQGDIAIITRDAGHIKCGGRICDVLYSAPMHQFKLPNGQIHVAAKANRWVCKLVGDSLPCPGDIQPIETVFVVVPDIYLRPVSGLPEAEDTTTDTPIKELA